MDFFTSSTNHCDNNLYSYHRRRNHSRHINDHRLHHHVYGNVTYANSTANFQLTSVNAVLPEGPPPPYQEYDFRDGTMQQPSQPAQSQHLLPVRDTRSQGRLRKKTSAWASTIHLSRPRDQHTHGQGRSWQNTVDLAPHEARDCHIAQSMNQCDAAVDTLADTFTEILRARLDDNGVASEQDDLVDMTQAIALEENGPTERKRSVNVVDFKKTWLYANSRLPPYLPPLRIYLSTHELICIAARASMRVYTRPCKGERQDYIDANWRQGTKAMVVKSVAMDHKNLIVIAIRGSKWNVVDWAVNFRPAPTAPVEFLDDEGNACHAGFLDVARATIAPLAARLRDIIQQNPSRASSTLLLTGHSAGGAVASLLYMHMMSSTIESELSSLTGIFKRVHCITFGTPPLTFLPLQNPPGRRFEKNIFYTFANEGDLVVRADSHYIRTLISIISSPSPITTMSSSEGIHHRFSRHSPKAGHKVSGKIFLPARWEVPPATLSIPGRIVLLREKPGKYANSAPPPTEAVQVTDEDLRYVVFGDPDMHSMELYRDRVVELATAAVTGNGIG